MIPNRRHARVDEDDRQVSREFVEQINQVNILEFSGQK